MAQLLDDLQGRFIGVDENPKYEQEINECSSDKLKTCLICGKPFIKNRRAVYCPRQHYTECVNCGKRLDIVDKYFRSGFVPKTCSKKCADIVGTQTYKNNCIEKYGVENPMYVQEIADKAFLLAHPNLDLSQRNAVETRTCEICGKEFTRLRIDPKQCCSVECASKLRAKHISEKTRICKLCGKPFTSDFGKTVYCNGPHYRECVICKKPFLLKDPTSSTQVCSIGCRDKLSRKVNLEKYGVEVGSQSQQAREKLSAAYYDSNNTRIDTCLQKYGTTNPVLSTGIKQKISQTVSSIECQQKIMDTCLNKYGVPHSSQDPEIHKKQWNNRLNIKASDGTKLDSSYEVIVYEFWKSLGFEVERNIPLEFEYEGTTHTTFIDFRVNGILYEVKGFHLLNGVYDYVGVPMSVKLDVYKKHHVIVITDKSELASNIFGAPNSDKSNGLKYLDKCPEPLIGVDIELFQEQPEFPFAEDRPKCFYDVKVNSKLSVYEAFYVPKIRWNMIVNRIQYSGGFIDNKQVLAAMNITRTYKQPSWFSKTLAIRLIKEYCSRQVIYDLAAGWGARYDACKELGRTYIGCDFNKELVDWHLENGRDTIVWHDGRTFTCDMPCSIFICPPYSDPKTGRCFEDYNFEGFNESAQSLSQCQWLLIAMKNTPKFEDATMVCKIVDSGWEKYVVETIENKSHFGINREYVVHITKEQYLSELIHNH